MKSPPHFRIDTASPLAPVALEADTLIPIMTLPALGQPQRQILLHYFQYWPPRAPATHQDPQDPRPVLVLRS